MAITVPGTSGIYRCEVSAEETFETDYREMNITIAGENMFNFRLAFACVNQRWWWWCWWVKIKKDKIENWNKLNHHLSVIMISLLKTNRYTVRRSSDLQHPIELRCRRWITNQLYIVRLSSRCPSPLARQRTIGKTTGVSLEFLYCFLLPLQRASL